MQQNIISDPLRYKYCPLYNLPIVSNTNKDCYNSEKLIDQIFTLPTHEGLDIMDLDTMIDVIKKYYA
ncbi:dTDP-4-amino-4,6-dideoxygalactose transaminase [Flavobacterium sp. CG_9.1]|nr:dTDP-4-amino-4,6-dideoxygalactose transaminase [Flavobacterium sp. CG_9.1]